ncbi:hypothetical protein HMPREF1398_01530 [Helicobacter pylori GAM117Ai]|uniref:hypothetical protein n=1 Tax=Helicobacter pylori TaxID=210 RepID=UPI00039026B7|nr:hypothetical protein [Helicobacter pylori]ERA54988.1 hypothetical protein HMPREF1398_01530 [Helicobacter pylori GAM117Ai]
MKTIKDPYSETELEQIAKETDTIAVKLKSLNSLCGMCENSRISIVKPNANTNAVIFDCLESQETLTIRCDANGCAINQAENIKFCDSFVEDKQKKDRLLNGFVFKKTSLF